MSLIVKSGAAALILAVDPAFSVDLQLIGGVLILQTIPAVFLGLLTAWFHRAALTAGLISGLVTGLALLWDIPKLDGTGRVVAEHFGGSSWAIGDGRSVYVGVVALAVNLVVTVVLTLLVRAAGFRGGNDNNRPYDYHADAGDPYLKRPDELIDGLPTGGSAPPVRAPGQRVL